jgi:toxin ParE1/3/4
MSRAIRKASAFLTDFEILFSWYLDMAGVDVAWRFQAALDVSLGKIAISPDLGRPRHFRHPKLRDLRSCAVERPFRNLLIFYRANDEFLDVIRLMHGARDLPRRLIQASS